MRDVAVQVPAPRTLPSASKCVNSPVAETAFGDPSNQEPSSTVTATWSPLAAVPMLSASATSRNLSELCAACATGALAKAAMNTRTGAIHRLIVFLPSLAGMRDPCLGGHRDGGDRGDGEGLASPMCVTVLRCRYEGKMRTSNEYIRAHERPTIGSADFRLVAHQALRREPGVACRLQPKQVKCAL